MTDKSGKSGGSLVVPRGLWRTAWKTEQEWYESARQLHDLMCRQFGLTDLDGKSVLDMGCGTKLSKLLIDERRPIARYVGVDVNSDVIDFLQHHVSDERFSYHHIDVQNDLYNPTGMPLADYSCLPLNGEQFDIICLFSVFTHLAPHDYHQMLRVFRPHIKPGGRLIYSLYVQEDASHRLIHALQNNDLQTVLRILEQTEKAFRKLPPQSRKLIEQEFISRTGSDIKSLAETDINDHKGGAAGVIRELQKGLSEKNILALARKYNELLGVPVQDYIDRRPDQPLLHVVYSRWYAHKLIEGTGWKALSLNMTESAIQHYFMCCPDGEDQA